MMSRTELLLKRIKETNEYEVV